MPHLEPCAKSTKSPVTAQLPKANAFLRAQQPRSIERRSGEDEDHSWSSYSEMIVVVPSNLD